MSGRAALLRWRTMHSLATPWPQYQSLLAFENTGRLNVGRRLRVAWAIRRTRTLRGIVDQTVERCPWMRPILCRHPILLSPLTLGYLDSRLGRKERFASFAHDLEFTSTRLHQTLPAFFSNALETRLWEDDAAGYVVDLNLNLHCPREGLWQLSLRSPGNPRLFCLCFSVVSGPTLFVGSVQGGRSCEGSTAVDLIRNATRDFHGLRPHFLLFDVLRTLAAVWRIPQIQGVATNRHVKARTVRHARKIRFSYDQYFQELGAQPLLRGNWRVPVALPDWILTEIPSRKRAMYRRRRELVADVRASVSTRIRGWTWVKPVRQAAG